MLFLMLLVRLVSMLPLRPFPMVGVGLVSRQGVGQPMMGSMLFAMLLSRLFLMLPLRPCVGPFLRQGVGQPRPCAGPFSMMGVGTPMLCARLVPMVGVEKPREGVGLWSGGSAVAFIRPLARLGIRPL